jgi:hypothetical protein
LPEMRCKPCIAIRNDIGWESMESPFCLFRAASMVACQSASRLPVSRNSSKTLVDNSTCWVLAMDAELSTMTSEPSRVPCTSILADAAALLVRIPLDPARVRVSSPLDAPTCWVPCTSGSLTLTSAPRMRMPSASLDALVLVFSPLDAPTYWVPCTSGSATLSLAAARLVRVPVSFLLLG